MSRTSKFIVTVIVFCAASILVGIVKEIDPGAAWIRILITMGAFALLLWLWTKKSAKHTTRNSVDESGSK